MRRKQQLYPILLLLILVLFHIINNFVWVKMDNYIPNSDDAEHLCVSLDYYELINSLSLKNWSNFFKMHNYYPPFFHYTSLILYFILGTSYKIAIAINWLYFIILIFSTYKIGEKLGNKITGLLSAFIVASYPAIFGLSRVFMLDFALCAMVTLSISLLLYTDNFRNKGISYLFGLSLGLGMLTKVTFILFLAFPLGFILIETYNLRKISETSKNAKKHIIGPLFFSFLIMCCWYIPNIKDMIRIFVSIFSTETADLAPYEIFTLKSFTFYIVEMINSQTTFIFFLMFLAGIIYVIRHKIKYKYFLLLSVFAPYFIFIWIRYKDVRFTSPILPVAAVISSLAIQNIKRTWVRLFLIALIIIYGIITVFSTSYSESKEISVHSFMGEIKLLSNNPTSFCGVHFKPQKASRDFILFQDVFRDIFKVIKELGKEKNSNKTIVGLFSNNKLPLSLESISLFIKMDQYPYDIMSFCVFPHKFIDQAGNLDILISSENLDNNYEKFKYSLRKSGLIRENSSNDIVNIWNGFCKSDKEKVDLKKLFVLLKNYIIIKELEYGELKVYIYALNRN